jgi:hypothetical protein
MTPAALALGLGLIACSPAGTKDSPMSTPPPKSAPASPTTASTAPAVPVARTRGDLLAHEGTPVQVEGTFRFPTEKAFAQNKLILDDGTLVVLPRPSTGVGAAELVEANAGARMAVRGVVYVGEIPAKYKIIGRTADPHLVELAAVELVK